mgnify:CR=1 FL=1
MKTDSAQIQYDKMTKTPINKLVLQLGLPTTVSMLVTSVYNMADTFFVSQLGTSVSGATGVVFALMAIINAFGFMFGHGAGSNISRKLGAHDIKSARKFASTSFFLSLLCGTLICILGFLFHSPFMRLLGSTDSILPHAIEYSTYYEDEWEPMSSTLLKIPARSTKLVKAESNIVNVANAQNVTFVDELYIRHLEEEAILNDDQQTLHLYADVYPVTAAYKNVNWTITQGEDLAYITAKGLLVANSTKGGDIIVRATAIDGSGTYAEISVPMSGIIPDNIITQNVDDMIIYPSPVSDLLFIKGIPLYANKAIVSIISMNGQCMFMKEVRNEETEISCSSYPTGTYLLRIVSEDKVTTRRFIKK